MPRLGTLAMASAGDDGSPAAARSLNLNPPPHPQGLNGNPVALVAANDNPACPPSSPPCLHEINLAANDNSEPETMAVESA